MDYNNCLIYPKWGNWPPGGQMPHLGGPLPQTWGNGPFRDKNFKLIFQVEILIVGKNAPGQLRGLCQKLIWYKNILNLPIILLRTTLCFQREPIAPVYPR